MLVAWVHKPLVNKQLSIGAGAIEDFKLIPSTGRVGSIAFQSASIDVEVSSHEAVGVVAHVPEGDEGERRPLPVLQRDLVLS